MKCSAPVAVVVLGVVMVCAALLYAVLLVGVPTPDATPEIAAFEARVEHNSNRCAGAGIILILIGLIWLCARGLLGRRAR